MPRQYIFSGNNLTVTNASPVTLAFIHSGTTASLEVLRIWVSQSGTATSAQQRLQLSTQVTAFPTVITAGAVISAPRGDAASGITLNTAGAAGTAGVAATAEGAGAKTVLLYDAFNVLNGWLWVPTPNETIYLPASSASGLGIVFPTVPTTLSGWSFGIVYEEQ